MKRLRWLWVFQSPGARPRLPRFPAGDRALTRTQLTVLNAVRAALAAFMALNLFGAFVPVGTAATGSLIPGNPSCATIVPNASSLKTEPVSGGVHTDGTLRVTITPVDTPDGPAFNWSSNLLVAFVIAKGGPNANGYDYRPSGGTSDTSLHAPSNAGTGKWYGLSHIDFCYGVSAPQESVTPLATPTRTPTQTPTSTSTQAPPTLTGTATSTRTPTATHTRTSTPTSEAPLSTPGTATLPPTGTASSPSQTGQIAIFKLMCDRIGDMDTCNGRDTSLSDYRIDFRVSAGPLPTGDLLQTLTVTLSDNANGVGNTGNGSQGRVVGAPLPL